MLAPSNMEHPVELGTLWRQQSLPGNSMNMLSSLWLCKRLEPNPLLLLVLVVMIESFLQLSQEEAELRYGSTVNILQRSLMSTFNVQKVSPLGMPAVLYWLCTFVAEALKLTLWVCMRLRVAGQTMISTNGGMSWNRYGAWGNGNAQFGSWEIAMPSLGQLSQTTLVAVTLTLKIWLDKDTDSSVTDMACTLLTLGKGFMLDHPGHLLGHVEVIVVWIT